MARNNTRALVTTALLIAMGVVLSRVFSIQTPVVKVGFSFLPTAMIAMLFGPVYAGIGAALVDFIGATLFPIGAYFPGFTLSAFLSGTISGLILYNKPKTVLRISAAVLCVSVFVHLGLNTLWLQMIMDKAYLALLPTRVAKVLFVVPIEIVIIRAFANERVLLAASGNFK